MIAVQGGDESCTFSVLLWLESPGAIGTCGDCPHLRLGKSDGVTLLRQLASASPASPGLPPAVMARDPLYTIPLSDDPGYQTLKGELGARMASFNLR